MPETASGDPAKIWNGFFKEFRPAPDVLRRWVLKLHNQKEHSQVIPLIQGALIHGQSQPWMYEVLALSMEIEGYPKESVERVVLSLTDFGRVDFASMMYSGAYLTRFGRKPAALRMYRQSSRMLPERPEPYLLGLKLAREVGTTDDVEWAATGILLHSWSKDHGKQHRDAENAVLETVRQLRKSGQEEAAERLDQALTQAKSRDLLIRLDWNGDADLDLYVEEPTGSVCSFETPLTASGGIHLHDGYGPAPENCYELYACPRGVSGPYRITVRHVLGEVVGNRAILTITRRAGLPDEERIKRTIILEEGEAGVTIDLEEGRRTQPRDLSLVHDPGAEPQQWVRLPERRHQPRRAGPEDREAIRDFRVSRQLSPRVAAGGRGAFGVAPVVQVVPEGTFLGARGVVSGDRRYVRLAIQPVFSNITDVFTFSFTNPGP